MQMTNKIPVTDRDITQKRIQAGNAPLSSCNYERAERAEPSHPILRSSLMSGRGSLLAHTLVMLGSLATMLVIARLIANPDCFWPKIDLDDSQDLHIFIICNIE